MGSVNSPKFLTDTENRRYLVFSAEKINYKHQIDMDKVWNQALNLVDEGFPYWFSLEELQKLNKVNEIYRQIPPEEEWLQKLYDPCDREDPRAKFLMTSEILTNINAFSGMRLSIKKLSAAMDKLKFGDSFSKRINGGSPRKVFSVLERKN